MANITVTGSCYWGGPEYNWSGLAYSQSVTIISGAVLTADPSIYPLTAFTSGVNITCLLNFSTIKFVNTTTTPYVYYGPYQGTLNVETGCTWEVSGNYISIGSGNGQPYFTTSGWTNIGYNPKDDPAVIFIEDTPGSGDYRPWMNNGGDSLSGIVGASGIGVGSLGYWFYYDSNSGTITFGDNGQPRNLSSDILIGQSGVVVPYISGIAVNDYCHLVQGTTIENVKIVSTSGTTGLTISGGAWNNFYASSGAYIRLAKGGNIPASGSDIRVYNIGFGTVSGSSNNISNPNVIGNNFELDSIYGGHLMLRNLYFFGFYFYVGYAGNVGVSGVGSYTSLNVYYLTEKSFSNYYVAPDKYTLSQTPAVINSSTLSRGITFIDCIFVRKYTSSAISAIHELTMRNCDLWSINRGGGTSSRAINVAINYANFSGVRFIGGVAQSLQGSFNTLTNIGFSDQPNGFYNPASTSNFVMDFINSPFSSLENFYIIPEGSCYGSTSSIVRPPERCINTTINAKSMNNVATPISLQDSNSEVKRCVVYSLFPTSSRSVESTAAIQRAVFQNIVSPKNIYSELIPLSVPSDAIFKACDVSTNIVAGSIGSATGTHFYEFRTGTYPSSSGCMGILFTPASSASSKYVTYDSDIVKFNLNGYMGITQSGAIEYEWPHWIIGVTGFPSSGAYLYVTGQNIAAFGLFYKINLGDGYSPDWIPFTSESLATHTINPEIGFKFKIKITHNTGSLTDYVNRLNWSTLVDYENYIYPLDEVSITLQNIVDGSEYWIYNETTGKVLSSGTKSGNLDLVITGVPFDGVDEIILIRVRKASSAPKYLPFETNAILTSAGCTVWVSQVRDQIVS